MKINEETLQKLIDGARNACKNAYCAYSRFPVGAAAISSDGAISIGCNVENASYGLTMCAERNAVFAMVGNGRLDLVCVVIYTPTNVVSAPCGACRQVLNEFGSEIRIVSICDGPERIDCLLSDLLPLSFGPQNLTADNKSAEGQRGKQNQKSQSR
jgi:cytidine deaminase